MNTLSLNTVPYTVNLPDTLSFSGLDFNSLANQLASVIVFAPL